MQDNHNLDPPTSLAGVAYPTSSTNDDVNPNNLGKP